jgi:hypothetical protein
MTELVTIQTLVLATNSRGAPWMKLLIFVVIAVFYGLSNILKARSAKLSQKDQKDLSRRPGPTRAEPGRGPQPKPPRAQPRPIASPQPPRIQRPQPPRRKLARPGQVQPKPVVPKQHLAPALPTVHGLDEEELILPMQSAKAGKRVAKSPLTKPRTRSAHVADEQKPALTYLPNLLTGQADPDELKMAIIYAEILGKPISLRRQSEHVIGL